MDESNWPVPLPTLTRVPPVRRGQLRGLDGYHLELSNAQTALRGRMNGYTRSERRTLDPPPIVRLRLLNELGVDCSSYIRAESLSLQASLLYDTTDGTNAAVGLPLEEKLQAATLFQHRKPYLIPDLNQPEGSSTSRPAKRARTDKTLWVKNLCGETRTHGRRLKNERAEEIICFVFHDIGVRAEGRYCFRYELFDFSIDPSPVINPDPICVLASLKSSFFKVWSAKSFPGMTDSTRLTRVLSMQGVPVIVRALPNGKRAIAEAVPNTQQQPRGAGEDGDMSQSDKDIVDEG